jgi:hypothetical protein
MRRASGITAGLALVGLATTIWLSIDISQHGALNTNGVERYAGANSVALVLSSVIIIGLSLMLVAAVLSLIHSARRGQWGWFVVLLLAVPLSVYGVLAAGFTANVPSSILALAAPLATLGYSLITPRLVRP